MFDQIRSKGFPSIIRGGPIRKKLSTLLLCLSSCGRLGKADFDDLPYLLISVKNGPRQRL